MMYASMWGLLLLALFVLVWWGLFGEEKPPPKNWNPY
jgi:hypothetical protein